MAIHIRRRGFIIAFGGTMAALPLAARAQSKDRSRTIGILALLWQIYSRCVLAQICFRQCGHRCGGGRAMSATMA